PTSTVAVLVADVAGNGFTDPQPGFILNAGATWGGDDQVVAIWDLHDSANCTGNDGGGLCAQTAVNYTGGIAPGERLKLYWFPSPSNTRGQTTSGAHTDTNNPAMEGDLWVIPPGGSSVLLGFITASLGGSSPDSDGLANLTTAVPPLAGFAASPTNGIAPLNV